MRIPNLLSMMFGFVCLLGCGSPTSSTSTASTSTSSTSTASTSATSADVVDVASAELPGELPGAAPAALAGPSSFLFADDVDSNRASDGALLDLEFVDTEGKTIRLGQYKNDKHVLLVFMRGFSGSLCPFCTTQTSRLIKNYDKIVARDTEILLVYPGSRSQLPQFQQASLAGSAKGRFPFPVLLDEDLVAVNRLGIAAHLAFPSTFIIDKMGQIQLAYVGENPSDRPSIKAILSKLDSLVK